MEPITYLPPQRDELLEDWKQTVSELLQQIQGWVQLTPGWRTETFQKEIIEEALGAYSIDSLIIYTPVGRLHVEPIARIVFGGRGTVEIFAWPTLYRVRLLRGSRSDDWIVLTDSGIALRQPWDEEHFVLLAQDLIDAQ